MLNNQTNYPVIPDVTLENGFRHIAAVEETLYSIRELPVETRRMTLNAYAFAFKTAYDSVISLRNRLEKEGEL